MSFGYHIYDLERNKLKKKIDDHKQKLKMMQIIFKITEILYFS